MVGFICNGGVGHRDINPGQPWSGERYPSCHVEDMTLHEPWWDSSALGVLARGISTLDNHGLGNDYPAAMVEDMMPDIQVMRYQEWDPGEMYTVEGRGPPSRRCTCL